MIGPARFGGLAAQDGSAMKGNGWRAVIFAGREFRILAGATWTAAENIDLVAVTRKSMCLSRENAPLLGGGQASRSRRLS